MTSQPTSKSQRYVYLTDEIAITDGLVQTDRLLAVLDDKRYRIVDIIFSTDTVTTGTGLVITVGDKDGNDYATFTPGNTLTGLTQVYKTSNGDSEIALDATYFTEGRREVELSAPDGFYYYYGGTGGAGITGTIEVTIVARKVDTGRDY